MTPEELARIHGEAFAPTRGWSESEFADLLMQKTVDLHSHPDGFALVQTVAGESELLTIAVVPKSQRQGIASALLQDWLKSTKADYAFLEVAEDNHAAIALYERHGFAVCGRRKGYYARPDHTKVDAVLMRFAITTTNTGFSGHQHPKTG